MPCAKFLEKPPRLAEYPACIICNFRIVVQRVSGQLRRISRACVCMCARCSVYVDNNKDARVRVMYNNVSVDDFLVQSYGL